MTNNFIDSLEAQVGRRALALLDELCGISSASGDEAGLRRMAQRLASELEAQGLVCELLEEPNGTGGTEPALVARSGQADNGHVVLVGHLDTVLAATATRRDGDRLFGTGALDMKGGLVTLVAALELMRRCGTPTPEDLLFVATPDEEASGVISKRLTRQFGARARVMLVLEPGETLDDGETIVVGRRGLTEWRLEIRGTPAHSGLDYWNGRSALAAAADWCSHAQKMSRQGRGSTVNVARLVAGDGDFVLQLDQHHGLLGTSRRRNLVPDHAVADGEIRFLSTDGGERTLDRLRVLSDRVAELHRVNVAFTTGTTLPRVTSRGEGALLVARARALAEQRGWTLNAENDRGGISFPNYLDGETDLPVLDGLGPIGNGMHTRDEYLDLQSLQRRIVLLADLLATM